MVFDPTNLAVNANLRPDRLASSNGVNETPGNGAPTEAGQTSTAGPAVVPEISAAALETSRAVHGPAQAADQNQAADSTRAAAGRPEAVPAEELRAENNQRPPAREEPLPPPAQQPAPPPGREPRTSRVDVVA